MKFTNKYIPTILFSIIFIFWLFVSVIKPIYNIFKEPTTFELMYGLASLLVIITFSIKIGPKIFDRGEFNETNFRVGNTKESNGCTSCKKKVKK